jgi:hypothetical protein
MNQALHDNGAFIVLSVIHAYVVSTISSAIPSFVHL